MWGKNSNKSVTSHRSSTASSVKIKATAEKAAVMARMAAFKERPALEEQKQNIKRKKEQLKLETQLAASDAMLAVLQDMDGQRLSQAQTDSMNSYFEKEKRKLAPQTLNPLAKEYEPVACKTQKQVGWSMQQSPKHSKNRQSNHKKLSSVETLQGLLDDQTTAWVTENRKQHWNHGQNDQTPLGDIVSIMCKQNEITASLVNQQRLLSLPPRDIPVFEGDPFQYKAFIKAFEQGVEDKASEADRLYYLEQFTRGQPRELVQSCQDMDPERGFIVAKALLQEHFGNEYKIANAYIEKALTWPAMKSEDGKSLQAYGLFLRGCCNVMEELPHMQELDMPSNMKTVVCKFPYKYCER